MHKKNMVQTIRSITIAPSQKTKVAEMPHTLHRIFFSVRVVVGVNSWYPSKISFGDPSFASFYILSGTERYFEMRGEDIFQGDIWVKNEAELSLWYAISEILR